MSKPNRKRPAGVTPLRPVGTPAEQQTGEPIQFTARVGGLEARGAAALVSLVAAHLRNVIRYEMAWDVGIPMFRVAVVPTTAYTTEAIRADWARILRALQVLYPTPAPAASSDPEAKTECPPSSPPASEG
jgi:hypothetical protein